MGCVCTALAGLVVWLLFRLLDTTKLLLGNESISLCWILNSRLCFNTLPSGSFIAVNLFLQTFPIFYETTRSPLSSECHQNHSPLSSVCSERPSLWSAPASALLLSARLWTSLQVQPASPLCCLVASMAVHSLWSAPWWRCTLTKVSGVGVWVRVRLEFFLFGGFLFVWREGC